MTRTITVKGIGKLSAGKLPAEERSTDALLCTIGFDFFEVPDSVTIARSRQHIEKYYNFAEIGKFPERLLPISKRPCLTDLESALTTMKYTPN